jgi:hypothetical protein
MIYIEAYHRIRFGRIETVKAHWLVLPVRLS